MIVERADLWQLANLTWLLKNALLHRASTATRVLMTAHAADGWPRVRAILDTYEAGTSSQHLPDSSRASGGRSRHVRCGAREIRRRLPDAGSTLVFMAGFLGGSESGLALTAHRCAGGG